MRRETRNRQTGQAGTTSATANSLDFTSNMQGYENATQGSLDLGIGADVEPANRLRTMICSERPQQRLESFGASALSDTELLALLLGSGTRGRDVLALATVLLREAGSVARLATWHEVDLRRVKGIGRAKAHRLVAIMELARRAIMHRCEEPPALNRPDLIAEFLQPYVAGLEVEKFWVLCLNRKNRLLKLVEITSGTASSTLVHPREVFRAAIREGALGVVCAHNHPSGDPAPSSADMRVTRQLREASRIVEIDLLDHLVVGRPEADPSAKGYYSFREAGII